MKKIKFIALLALCFAGAACSSNDDNDNDNNLTAQEKDNKYVNNWIYKTMRDVYYWNSQIPSPTDNDLIKSPDSYFYSILYKYEQADGDRFSWIQENYADLLASLSGVNNGDIGFEYLLRGYSNNDNIWGEVLYVKPNTNAARQGIKRGDVFTKINATELTRTNYSSLLETNNPTITFYDASIASNVLSLSNERNLTISRSNYSENPIFLDSIYNINGKKIGYLVYNFFACDNGDDSNNYDKELNTIFGNFKAAGINNLIIDLRYNSGGAILSSQRIASMIVKSLSSNNIFYTLKYNSNYTNDKGYFVSNIGHGVTINNLGATIENVCFITSSWTASASEMLINGLKPYMNNISMIGDTTVGKSYASSTFCNENDNRNKWGIQPLIAFFVNAQNAEVPSTGIVPNFEMMEYSFVPKKQLGDIHEELLNAALTKVTGAAVTHRERVSTKFNSNIIGTSVNQKAYSNRAYLNKNRE